MRENGFNNPEKGTLKSSIEGTRYLAGLGVDTHYKISLDPSSKEVGSINYQIEMFDRLGTKYAVSFMKDNKGNDRVDVTASRDSDFQKISLSPQKRVEILNNAHDLAGLPLYTGMIKEGYTPEDARNATTKAQNQLQLEMNKPHNFVSRGSLKTMDLPYVQSPSLAPSSEHHGVEAKVNLHKSQRSMPSPFTTNS